MSELCPTCAVGNKLPSGKCDHCANPVPSEIPVPKTAGPAKVVAAVATGSLWVSAGLLLQLQRAWEMSAHTKRQKAAINAKDDMGFTLTDALIDQAQTLDDCANELGLLLVDATVRQPTENDQGQPPRKIT